MTADGRPVKRMLRDIEHRVLEEVSFGRVRFVTTVALVALLSTTVVIWRLSATTATPAHSSVPTVAAAMLLLAAAVSGVALAVRRYRWCCTAAYCCGLASAIGIGAFWWLRTGRPGAVPTWLTLADLAVVALTVVWLAAIITPIERSQPDMRTAHVSRLRQRTI